MRIDDTPFARPLGLRPNSVPAYVAALAITVAAVVLRLELDHYIAGVQFLAFFPAIFAAAYVGGIGPGIVAAILCGIASWYLIVPPRSSWIIDHPAQLHALVVYFAVGPVVAVAVGAMRRAMTRQRAAEAHLQLLVAELQHRTRNQLAVVRTIADQTLRSSDSLATFGARFSSRLAALGRVQSLLSRGNDSIDLGELVRSELVALNAEPDGDRIRLAGPPLLLAPQAVQVMALALHELATNAVKHGALAQDDGRLSVTWTVTEPHGEVTAVIDWVESGVVLAGGTSPRGSGFGRQLIERALPYDLGATTKLEFTPDGVRCRIELPLAAS